MYKVSLVLVTTFFCGFVRTEICQKVDSCRCTYKDSHIDLSPIVDPYRSPKFKDIYDQFYNFRYSYNPCLEFSEGNCSNVAVCMLNEMGQYFNVGTQDSADFINDNGNVHIEYRGDTGSITRVELICSYDQSAVLQVLGEGPPGTHEFKLYGKYSCAVTGGLIVPDIDSTLSVGLMLIIGLSTFLVLAVILALIFNKCAPKESNVQIEQRYRRNTENNQYELLPPTGSR